MTLSCHKITSCFKNHQSFRNGISPRHPCKLVNKPIGGRHANENTAQTLSKYSTKSFEHSFLLSFYDEDHPGGRYASDNLLLHPF